MSRALPKTYDPHAVEPRWAEKWAQHPFTANPKSGKKPFVIFMPPPNVTGNLHMGHALDNALQDALIRYKRMRGYEALWLPGTDHAGIATQVVVERLLAKEGTTRHALGREAFLKRVWEWKETSGGAIIRQLKRLGASPDWSREAFTMDEARSRAVRYAFVRYYHEGLAYRAGRIVNWCPRCETTLSDLEVNTEHTPGTLYTLAYPLEDGGEIQIATVRPETIFADQAIAVHPEDERYAHLIGKKARIPLTDTWIPIIADAAVEREFGTGALKVTPAHDPTDFEIGQRHGLEAVSVINLEARLEGPLVPEALRGLERFEARRRAAEMLEAAGHVRKAEPYTIALGTCDRCGTPIEPALFPQWWLSMKPLAEKVIAGIERGEIQFVPERWRKVNLDWLRNIRDWNISRQLWWGHQIPAWHCKACGEITVPPVERYMEDPQACAHCGSPEIERDPDVFDTWFSSALWPLSTLGWPEETEDLKAFYPGDVLVTGYDILFLWVSRMEVSGYHFKGERPFKTVLLHGLVLDEKGQKMSKSKGNVVDPLELVEAYGADALRFALVHLATGGQDIRFDRRWVEMGRNFANKLWNAARFVLMNREGFEAKRDELTLADRWMQARLAQGVREITALYERYDLALAAREVYQLVWSEFCDWYIEAAKPALREGNAATLKGLENALETLLKLLHPLMPFVTSEIYAALKGEGQELALAPWPEPAQEVDPEALAAFKTLQDAVSATRALRAELGLPPQQEVRVYVDGEGVRTVLENAAFFRFLARAEAQAGRPEKALSAVTPSVTVFLEPEGLVDLSAWRSRQEKRLKELEKLAASSEKKLGNPRFVERAPREVVEAERARLKETQAQIARIRENLARLG
ncbi:valine--tRNA ligase [Marinithermus hydrothermalis]|uniref:Valine--tRNA ligase n=1 Tax=Marinithermus hydrothermalis (strain DSM 14884 / JCM 11576 / T1) TaxID=869210 RepID=F2NP26_MARHT|nr:valine--tRNA ligase [Marinithermus hydrothermalis]AEB11614.1 Valyl-tRNA synthetase [Marinithermus hydrothermalis DSM 14884]